MSRKKARDEKSSTGQTHRITYCNIPRYHLITFLISQCRYGPMWPPTGTEREQNGRPHSLVPTVMP